MKKLMQNAPLSQTFACFSIPNVCVMWPGNSTQSGAINLELRERHFTGSRHCCYDLPHWFAELFCANEFHQRTVINDKWVKSNGMNFWTRATEKNNHRWDPVLI